MTLEQIVDRLYGLPLAEFTSARNEAAKELRREGRREDASAVAALRKPTAVAAAVNRLVRGQRRDVEAFLRAASVLRDAQVAGKGDVASAVQKQRKLLDHLVASAGAAVRPTLQAAAVDDGVAAVLLRARLEREPDPPGFGTLLAHAAPAAPGRAAPAVGGRKPARVDQPPAAKPAPARPARVDDRPARARLREAAREHAAAAAAEREARQRWAESQRTLEAAVAALERAERELHALRGT